MIRFRGDIEGLRAVAVLMVILDHLRIGGFRGGFTGVDVFFVISGYLITSLLAAEYAKKAAGGGIGSISIGHFYLRRARRILPAALVVIGAVVVASHLLLNVLRVEQVQHDALWATFFGSNVNFIQQSTDYFAAGLVSSSPFGHYWSLSVEEQFYFVWPALFLLVVGIHGLSIRGRRIGWRLRLGIALVVVGTFSLIWSIVDTAANPASAYYSTFTRTWELALGALIGVGTTGSFTMGRQRAAAVSMTGVALLLAGWIVIDGNSAFPGYLALLPTVGAGLLILGGMSDTLPVPNRIISIAPMRFLGRISYSLYLWHWPLIVFAAALYPRAITEFTTRAAIFALTIVVATISFYLIEQPFRRKSFSPGGVPPDWLARNLGDRGLARLKIVGGVAAVAAVSLGIGAAIASTGSPTLPAVENATAAQVEAASPVGQPAPSAKPTSGTRERQATAPQRSETALVRWHAKVGEARSLRSLPVSLRPLDSHLANAPAPCQSYRLAIVAHERECAWGRPNARHVAAITGDSHAAMWLQTLEAALDWETWSLHPFTRSWCGWAPAPAEAVAENKDCPALQAQTLAQLEKLHVDVLVLSEASVHTFEQMRDALRKYAKVAKTVVVLGVTPAVVPDFPSCLRGATDISSCHGNLTDSVINSVMDEQRAAGEFKGRYIDTTPWFCYAGTCPSVIDNAPVFSDGNHITAEMAAKLVPVLQASLRESGALPP